MHKKQCARTGCLTVTPEWHYLLSLVGWVRWDANVNASTFGGLHESVGMACLMRMGEGWGFLNGVLGHERAGYGGLCGVGWMRWDANVNVSTFGGLHEIFGLTAQCLDRVPNRDP